MRTAGDELVALRRDLDRDLPRCRRHTQDSGKVTRSNQSPCTPRHSVPPATTLFGHPDFSTKFLPKVCLILAVQTDFSNLHSLGGDISEPIMANGGLAAFQLARRIIWHSGVYS
jgi:hypothetical protein